MSAPAGWPSSSMRRLPPAMLRHLATLGCGAYPDGAVSVDDGCEGLVLGAEVAVVVFLVEGALGWTQHLYGPAVQLGEGVAGLVADPVEMRWDLLDVRDGADEAVLLEQHLVRDVRLAEQLGQHGIRHIHIDHREPLHRQCRVCLEALGCGREIRLEDMPASDVESEFEPVVERSHCLVVANAGDAE